MRMRCPVCTVDRPDGAARGARPRLASRSATSSSRRRRRAARGAAPRACARRRGPHRLVHAALVERGERLRREGGVARDPTPAPRCSSAVRRPSSSAERRNSPDELGRAARAASSSSRSSRRGPGVSRAACAAGRRRESHDRFEEAADASGRCTSTRRSRSATKRWSTPTVGARSPRRAVLERPGHRRRVLEPPAASRNRPISSRGSRPARCGGTSSAPAGRRTTSKCSTALLAASDTGDVARSSGRQPVAASAVVADPCSAPVRPPTRRRRAHRPSSARP